MEAKENRINSAVIVAALLLTLLLYVGSYLALVEAQPMSAFTGMGAWPRPAGYRLGGAVAENVFFPVNWLDRKLRWDYWNLDGDEFRQGER